MPAKRATTSYMFFVKENRKSVVDANPDMKFGEISAELGRQWKALSEKKKAKYVKLGEEEKKRYLEDVEKYGKPERKAKGAKGKGKKVKKEKKPRATSAYIFFTKEVRNTIKEENPEMEFGEVSAELGRQWKALPDEDKAKFLKMAEEDKKRVEALKKEKKEEEEEEKEEEEEEVLPPVEEEEKPGKAKGKKAAKGKGKKKEAAKGKGKKRIVKKKPEPEPEPEAEESEYEDTEEED